MIRPQAASSPAPIVLKGRYCRLEPMTQEHAADMFIAISGPEADARHRWLFSDAPADLAALQAWISMTLAAPDQLYFAVIDTATGRCGGRHALMRLRPEHGSIEIGGVLWGAGVAKTRLATEAFYITAKHVFDDLGYRRFEWKCNDRNLGSKRAATRFGFTFEGVFRQDMIVKGENRDTAWFSMLDHEWPDLKARFETFLDPANFDETGQSKTPLSTPRLPPSG